MTIIAILVALALSGTAAYFSILGLTAIFPASFWPIVVMASVLECAKIVTVVWLHQHWYRVGTFIKIYLSIAIILLMGITSMGVFGFLSKAHIEHQVKIDSGVGQQIKLLEEQIKTSQTDIGRLKDDIDRLDSSIVRVTELSKTAKEARSAIAEANKAKKERDRLDKERTSKQVALTELESQKIKLEGERDIQEAEVGPIKYLANLFYDNASRDQLETAVRWAIIVLVMVFDPLAIMLLLGASTLFQKKEVPEKPTIIAQRNTPINRKKKGIIEIPDNDLTKW